MSTEPQFTKQQILDWHCFEEIRQSGRYNMFDPRARRASTLTGDEYSFTMKNYSKLKAAAEAEAKAVAK